VFYLPAKKQTLIATPASKACLRCRTFSIE
jgi:hypothetical protein